LLARTGGTKMSEIINNTFPHYYFSDLKVFQFGRQQCKPFHSPGTRMNEKFLFHYVISGTGVFIQKMEDEELVSHIIEAGQGFLILPNQIASYVADEKNPWQYIWIEFGGIKARDIIMHSGLTLNRPIYTAVDELSKNNIEKILLYIVNNPEASLYDLMGHFYLFVNALAETNINSKKIDRSSLQDFYVQQIISFVEENYQKNIQVEDIATFCKLDRGHISKIFKNNMGITLREYLVHCRINKACELMKTTTHSLDQISEMVGYSNTFNFSRAFKASTGQAPSQWRSKNRLK